MPDAKAPGLPRARAWILAAVVALGGALLYAAFYALVTPDLVRSTDPSRPFGYVLVPDDDERVGAPHLVTLAAWSHRTQAPPTASLSFREGADGPFRTVPMQRIGGGTTYAAELPPFGEGQRAFYFVTLADATGARTNVPEAAPAAPLLHVRWEDRVELWVLALHVTLMIGALFFLIHAVHFALLAALRGDGATRRTVVRKLHRGIRWGWLCFFVGGIPLGLYVSGAALGWHNAWGGWPLGSDITDTKTEVLLAYWGAALLARPDLGWAWLPWRPLLSDRGLAGVVLGGAALTAAIYAIPHSYFFQ